jgi:hypothetical protein
VEYIATHADPAKLKEKDRKKWLDGRTLLGPRWTACYAWAHRTWYGSHSTQRAEATNSAIATFCNKKSTIVRITEDLEQLADVQGYKSEVEQLRGQLCSVMGARGHTVNASRERDASHV